MSKAVFFYYLCGKNSIMDAKELRIGNYVSHEETPNWFPQLDIGLLTEITDENHLFQPIPLTEEWLVKFKYRYNKKGKYWISPNGFKLWNSGTKKKPYFYHLNDELLINIDYVHHLQNVEFALTKKELDG